MLKKICPSIIKGLLIIFNKSLVNGKFPENMKLAKIKPMYEIINYRPISLLPVISKVLEKVVHCRVVKFLDKNRILYKGQYGFRGNRGTCTHYLTLLEISY